MRKAYFDKQTDNQPLLYHLRYIKLSIETKFGEQKCLFKKLSPCLYLTHLWGVSECLFQQSDKRICSYRLRYI